MPYSMFVGPSVQILNLQLLNVIRQNILIGFIPTISINIQFTVLQIFVFPAVLSALNLHLISFRLDSIICTPVQLQSLVI